MQRQQAHVNGEGTMPKMAGTTCHVLCIKVMREKGSSHSRARSAFGWGRNALISTIRKLSAEGQHRTS